MFCEGKMLGVLEVEGGMGDELLHEIDGQSFLFAFSGLAGGRNLLEGFVEPIFDYMDPDGHFKETERKISDINERLKSEDDAQLRLIRKEMSVQLQHWLFEQYVVHNAEGAQASIASIFSSKGLVPPGGTGECAGAKLLEYAYRHGYKPIAMGEFWYGKSPAKEIRRHGSFYPSCTSKCGPLLGFMLQGLDVQEPYGVTSDYSVVYEDEYIIVVDKPSGMLSVPGRIPQKSLLEHLRERYGTEEIFSCHRLDMDTSGYMVFARSLRCQSEIQIQFEKREVRKAYLAKLLPGENKLSKGMKGTIDLPLYPDWDNRPRQMVDHEDGKASLTDYEVLSELSGGFVMVRFVPHTGRTHQLRVHSAHQDGLGRPIFGDRLYGGLSNEGDNLCLRAVYLSLRHPISGEILRFEDSCTIL